MLHLTNEFLLTIESPTDGTRPSRTGGTAFSIGASNVEGSYTQFLDGSTAWPAGSGDGYELYLEFGDVNVSGGGHSVLATIGIDPAGGTSYTEWIHDLLITGAPTGSLGQIGYRFPLRIPNGASLAVKAQDSNASPPATPHIRCQIKCQPTRPELIRYGTKVVTFGANVASSSGTAVTEGTVSEGAYAQLGVALTEPLWAWEFGWSSDAAAFAATLVYSDIAIGDATNKRRVIHNGRAFIGTVEYINKDDALWPGEAAIGDLVYGRCQVGDNPAPGSASMIAYGVGG